MGPVGATLVVAPLSHRVTMTGGWQSPNRATTRVAPNDASRRWPRHLLRPPCNSPWQSRPANYVVAPVVPGVAVLNLPNLITIGRILLVPVVVWAIGSGQMQIAFLV